MSKITSPVNYNEWVNLSDTGLEFIPVRRKLISSLGLFTAEYFEGSDVYLPITSVEDYKLVDTPYTARSQNLLRDKKSRLKMEIPHFGVEGAIFPSDVKQKIAWEDFMFQNRAESVTAMFDKEKTKARQALARTKDEAMYQLILSGDVYAPNGTVVNNLYTAFGVTRSDVTLSLNQSANPMESVIAMKDDIVSNFKGGFEPTRFVCLLNKAPFDKLVTNPYVLDVAKAGYMTGELLAGVLGTQIDAAAARNSYYVLDFAGVLFIRCADSEITAGEGRMFPVDVPDMFKVLYAPSELTFDTVNTTAQEEYYFENVASDRTNIKYILESNFACVTLWPKAIIRVVASYA